MEPFPLIIIGGPTASGKTNLSLTIAKHFDCEIISADSRQVFKYLDIGTAKPTKEEMLQVPHHFVDILDPTEYFSAGIFGEQSYQLVKSFISKGKLPLIVGGSGLYIDALCFGLADHDESSDEDKKNLYLEYNQIFEEKGRDYLWNELNQIDPESANIYTDKNPKRLIRALVYFKFNGKPFSLALQTRQKRLLKPMFFSFQFEREYLYKRINERTDEMWSSGLIEETQNILSKGYSEDLNSLNTVGYKECIGYLKGNLSKADAINLMKMNTRRYAKRQITWFKRYADMNYLDSTTNYSEGLLRKIGSIFK